MEEKGPNTTDHMDLDPQTPEFIPAATPTAKDPINTPPSAHCARAFVVHGVACSGPLTHKMREVERAFGGKGRGVIGVRWLLQWNRIKRKTASSLVVYHKRAVPTALGCLSGFRAESKLWWNMSGVGRVMRWRLGSCPSVKKVGCALCVRTHRANRAHGGRNS